MAGGAVLGAAAGALKAYLNVNEVIACIMYVTIAIPLAVIFSSFFIQHITSGGAYVDKMVYCSQI
ncbi:MAG: hypothetical protein V8R43_04410 [Dorea sp.]